VTRQHVNDRLINWASLLDQQTLDQAKRTASMPFVYPHLALMPDAHLGKGATVGSGHPDARGDHPRGGRRRHRVRHDRGPHAAGHSDVAAPRPARAADRDRAAVPLSAGRYNTRLDRHGGVRVPRARVDAEVDYEQFARNWRLQLGTLGSGNHFIEVTVR
jgi:tRNA-splicing ligase RtcB